MRIRIHSAAAIAAVTLVIIALVLSFAFIASSTFHHCTHDDSCAVCRMTDAQIHTLRGMTVIAVTAVFSVTVIYNAINSPYRVSRECTVPTPVSMKTLLLN